MDIKRAANETAAVYANKFYVQAVDDGRNVKLTFFEESSSGELAARSALLISRANAEALLRVAGEVLETGDKDSR